MLSWLKSDFDGYELYQNHKKGGLIQLEVPYTFKGFESTRVLVTIKVTKKK